MCVCVCIGNVTSMTVHACDFVCILLDVPIDFNMCTAEAASS